MTEKVCSECKYVVRDKDFRVCPVCGNDKFLDKYHGFVYIFDYDRSEVAKKLDIKTNGKYALRIRGWVIWSWLKNKREKMNF